MNSMNDVLECLKSSKVKERAEGLKGLTDAFSRDRAVSNFHITKDGKGNLKVWCTVFDAAFQCFRLEKDALMKKLTSKGKHSVDKESVNPFNIPGGKNFQETVRVIRWLVERTVEVNVKATERIFNHLSNSIRCAGILFPIIAPDYTKALRCMLEHAPHLQHLKLEQWIPMVRIGFNIVLGRPVNAVEDRGQSPGPVDMDSDMFADDSPGDEQEPPTSTSDKGRKRTLPSPIKARKRSRRSPILSVSVEQIEFVSILRLLIGSSTAPILRSEPEHAGIPTRILVFLEQFLERYPSDSSLLQDYISILSSTLNHLSLNRKTEVERFARSTWDGLIGLWATKDKRLKEGLLVVLRRLFPFFVCPVDLEQPTPFPGCAEGVSRLWHLLNGEAENRWGVDGLSLEALRLEIRRKSPDTTSAFNENSFMANTFRAGWGFDAGQALSWAMLELQADCASQLFQLSEQMQPTPGPEVIHTQAKSFKLENPVTSLLSSIRASNAPHVRAFHLQTLLFFIDRHWELVHDSLKQEVVHVLLQFVGYDDAAIQSWVFLNFAAIAYAEGLKERVSRDAPASLDSTIWDPIWTHAARKANVPGICRAACHTGYALLISSRPHSKTLNGLVTFHKVLLEIETLFKDMDVQGPTYPFDSVCFFLSQCLGIASQDVRLYRMHLEDKVLTWFVDNWKTSGNRMKMDPCTIGDILRLLETVCSLTKRVDIAIQIPLPPSDIVDSIKDENKVKIIRDYLLYAKLPPMRSNPGGHDNPPVDAATLPTTTGVSQLVAPRARERKVSSFFQRTLYSLLGEWEYLRDSNPTAETTRRSLDVAITALAFESLLVLNGTSANRQVLQTSGKVISMLMPLLKDARWTPSEKILVAQAFEVMVPPPEYLPTNVFSEALSQPNSLSGIKERTLQALTVNDVAEEKVKAERATWLKLMWQNPDIQTAVNPIATTLRSLLGNFLGDTSSHPSSEPADLEDDFGPIRTAHLQNSAGVRKADREQSIQRLLQISLNFLASGPFLQSPSGEPTRDKELIATVIRSAAQDADNFAAVCPIFFHHVRLGTVCLPFKDLDEILDIFASLIRRYQYSHNQEFLQRLLSILQSTLGIWKHSEPVAQNAHLGFQQLCHYYARCVRDEKFPSWALRDSVASFLGHYLCMDPTLDSWGETEEEESQDQQNEDGLEEKEREERREEKERKKLLPDRILSLLNDDPDLRVRFRVAVANASLFSIAQQIKRTPVLLYQSLQASYPRDPDQCEQMLGRALALGNIMVVSSEVRRGVYWNLLETCKHNTSYSGHIEVILNAVAERLGMRSLSSLFEEYASQLAYSFICNTKSSLLELSPHLLGYRDRKQCAQATLCAFTPTNVMDHSGAGAKQVERHCDILHINVSDALQVCFGDIAAYCITASICQEKSDEKIESDLREKLSSMPDFNTVLREHIDGVVASILRCLGDQDISHEGPIIGALRSLDKNGKMVHVFRSLTLYRATDSFIPHTPNLPNIPTSGILQSLVWLENHYRDAFTKATTYHVFHQLLHSLQKTSLVNEQYRLVNALSLWIAYRHQDFLDPVMLHTLTHGATLILSQSDLARAAQSLLTWSLRHYRKSSVKAARLPNILLRIFGIAHEYSSDTANPSLSQMGKKMLQWIDERVVDLAQSPTMTDTVFQVLAAWPHPPESGHSSLHDQITGFNIQQALQDHRITSNKFRLVRRLKECAPSREEGMHHNAYFWQLKACIPSSNVIQDEDVHAFVDILSSRCGQIGTFPADSPNLTSSSSLQRSMVKDRKERKDRPIDPIFAGKNATVHALFTMLEGQESSQVSNAYDTLRLVTAVLSVEEHQAKLPFEYGQELELLNAHRRMPVTLSAVDLSELLTSEVYLESITNFPRWIRVFSTLLVGILTTIDPFYGQLSSILDSDVAFPEDVLPVLVHALLQLEGMKKIAGSSPRKVLSKYFSTILSSTAVDMCCLRSIVDVVLHLRSFNPRPNDALAHNKWLKVDFRLLAQGAKVCGAYTTALLFLELAHEHNDDTPEAQASTEQVLYDIYSHIDEPDGFYGINTKDLHQFLIKRFHHERQWDKAFQFHGAALEADRSRGAEQEGLLESFHYFGFDHLAIDTLRNSSSSARYPSSMSYKLGWRTETWDLPDQSSDDAKSAPLYRSLRAVYRERDPVLVQNIIRASLREEMDRLRLLGDEDLAEIQSITQDLMCLGEILHWQQESVQGRLHPENMSLNVWSDFFNIDANFEFFSLESIMATRISLVRSVRQREERQQLGNLTTPFLRGLIDVEKKCLLRLSEAARLSGQVQVALNSVVRAQRLCIAPSWDVCEEFANVLWLQKEERPAVQFLQDTLQSASVDESSSQLSRKALLLSRLGAWTAEACLEKPTKIWEDYFSSSISLLDRVGDQELVSTKASIYRACAMFAERQYHATLESPDAIRRKLYVDRKKKEIADRQSMLESQRDAVKRKGLLDDQVLAQKLFNEDSELFRKHNVLLETFLKQAIEMHSRCLETSSEYDDDSAIRICSLWFANFDDQLLLETVRSALERIPSLKLVFLAHQLTARLSNPPTAELPRTQQNLQSLVTRMCFEHPFHSLYQLYSLADQNGSSTSNRRQSGRHSQSQSTQTERGTAANTIFDRLEGDPTSKARVREIKTLCDACVEWAKYKIAHNPAYKKRPKDGFLIPSDVKLWQLSKLNIPVTTSHTPLDPTLQYNNFISITCYKRNFSTAGGVNMPKICTCVGSDGQDYRQLLKGEGKDDLRQDAVMEQVFDLVNNILRRDRETRRRSLSVRGYTVVPLASPAGLLEFVGNTSPLIDWLQRGHDVYRPHDIKSGEFYARMKKVQEEHKNQPDKQLEIFLNCRQKFKPVMRHYFTEQNKTPITWFQQRLKYTRSVATTSIVGHVLGLGDRHVSNILLDSSTGEVVHIDLGIAFDQGKLLNIPERVPFRMTADMVDGMGTSGTAGVFQRCAEETLRVLRNESGVIMTVLEVFKHDPLHQWTASEFKVKQAQSDVAPTPTDASRFNLGIGLDMTSGSADESADRALSSVARKLDKSLSVESTVNELLAEATDPMNLATIFYGWKPFF